MGLCPRNPFMSVTISGIRSTSTFGVNNGGTGATQFDEGGVLIGHGTNPVTSITGSDGQVLTWSDADGSWIAAAPSGGGGGGGASTVTTSGNLQGTGTAGSPVTLKANISLTSVTASFSGNGYNIGSLQTSNITNFVTNVRNQLSGAGGISYDPTTGVISSSLSSGGGLSTVNTTGNLQGDGSAGSPVALKANISLTSVTASLSGDGSGITGLQSSQLSDFNSAVDARITNIPNASLQNSSITINGSSVSLGGTVTVADASTMTFTAAGFSAGDVVALSGSLVKADYSDSMKSNAFGVVSAVSGNTVTVRVFGEVTTNGASNYADIGTLVYVGANGAVTNYAGVGSGKYLTQIGIISSSGKIIIQPRIFGQLA